MRRVCGIESPHRFRISNDDVLKIAEHRAGLKERDLKKVGDIIMERQ